MSEKLEPIEDVLARHGRPGANPVMEKLLYGRLSGDKRSFVDDRIRIIDRYLREKKKGLADPVATAAAIGISVRSLYRLLVRVKEMGAVAALAPTKGAGRTERSDRWTGISPDVDEIIRVMVRSDPHVRLGPVYRKVAEADATVHQSTVRRRLFYWRGHRDPGVDARFGRAWLLERGEIDIPVRRDDGRTTWLPVHFLVDIDTGIVIGASPAPTSGDLVWDAFPDAATRIGSLPESVPVADRVERVIWAQVGPDRAIVRRIEEHAQALTPPVVFESRALMVARPESELINVLGVEFGFIRLLNAQAGHARPLPRDRDVEPVPGYAIGGVLGQAVAEMNKGALLRLAGTHGSDVQPGPRANRLRSLFNALMDVFEPVVPVGTAKAVASALDRLD